MLLGIAFVLIIASVFCIGYEVGRCRGIDEGFEQGKEQGAEMQREAPGR